MERHRFEIRGVVQGVGFRPFVYRLAKRYHLRGMVFNHAQGVTIDVEGENGTLESFLQALQTELPPLAQIHSIQIESLPVAGYSDFKIQPSRRVAEHFTLISPDIATCSECLAELFDPKDRRYRYPFINCTNCGPRYTITSDIPYDRPNTTMASFQMCPDCQREYDDPMDRRFHAQPNACPRCGPQVWLLDAKGQRVEASDVIQATVDFLKCGKIIAIKGMGGFHLAVDATQEEAVQRLRWRKHREEKPLAVMASDLEKVAQFAWFSQTEANLLTSPQRPIVLLKKKPQNSIAPSVAPNNKYFGVMLPYTPLHYLIFQDDFLALVMTSGNLSEEPIAIDNAEALQRLSKIADYFLFHDRDILIRSDDSVCRIFADKILPVRRSRGFVPLPIHLSPKFEHQHLPSVLGCGAELKNTLCLTKGDQAFVSQHIGDLENLETWQFYLEIYEHLRKILEITPQVLAYDLHPQYLSTQWALEQEIPHKIGVQHHHAHIAACLAEHGISEKVIGFALDGTGYGLDGNIWGGEVLIADLQDFVRVAHFEYLPLPGGAQAIKEPWRMAVSYLWKTFGNQMWNRALPILQKWDTKATEFLVQMMQHRLNSPLTSSCGRLFDGVAALLGLRQRVSFEGQAAMELEMHLESDSGRYATEWTEQDNTRQFLIAPLIEDLVADIERGVFSSTIACRFHNTLVRLFTETAIWLREQWGINLVALSGGCFQNVYLLSALLQQLQKRDFKVLIHSKVPPNDGGISLGQTTVALGKYLAQKN